MVKNIAKFSRNTKLALLIFFDAILVVCVLFIAFWIRLGYFFYPNDNELILFLIYASPLLALPIFLLFGIYRLVIRYLSIRSIWLFIKAVSTYAILWGIVVLMFRIEYFPRSVVLINLTLVILLIVSSRFLVRWILMRKINTKNVVIYGAGSAGRQLSTALDQSKEYNPIAFIDDFNEIQNHNINGLKVYSPKHLKNLIDGKDVKEVLLAMPSLARSRRNEILNYLNHYGVIVRSLPGVTEIAQGKVSVNDLLEIDLTDLLGRESVKPNKKLFKMNIFDKVVMVTGAGGSIGSELCRQILLIKPKKLILYELSESSLYQIEQELISINEPNIEVYPVIGSVTDEQRTLKICEFYSVQTIYHAAAYKHVPLVESNQSQGIFNNTIGTLILAQAAISSNVETFVLISTDKAVRPTSYMGASKRAAEMVLQALAELPNNTCFTMVRFGNVIDSSGSVIPLFKKQIKKGGPITLTHSDIVRYFMTIPEAVELVIQAGAMAKGGEVFLLDMGAPVRIYDLAVKMINLSGLVVRDENNPQGDIEIKVTGLRPGEKLYEELLIEGNFTLTENQLIMRAEEKMISWSKLEPIIDELSKEGTYMETKKLDNLIKRIVPEFKGN